MPTKLRRWSPPAASIALAILALTGCTDAKPISPPKPTTEPVFASEEEALAAGTAAYEEYLEAWNAIVIDGGTNVARIDQVTTGELNRFEHESLAALAELGWTFSGGVALNTFQIHEWYPVRDAAGVVLVGSACVDLAESQAVDSTGQSVVAADRPRTRTWDVHISLGGPNQAEYVLSKHEVKKEGSTCGD